MEISLFEIPKIDFILKKKYFLTVDLQYEYKVSIISDNSSANLPVFQQFVRPKLLNQRPPGE